MIFNLYLPSVNYTFTATTTLKHDEYIQLQPGNEVSVICTPVSIDVDLVYSVDRRFQLKFELLNELDMFAGVNEFTITTVENGNQLTHICCALQVITIKHLDLF